MKKIFYSFTLILFLLTFIGCNDDNQDDSIEFDKTYVPDDQFEKALIDLGYDDVLDDYVLTNNIRGVDYLFLPNANIEDLAGIEDFENLEVLRIEQNNLSDLDLSNNVLLTRLVAGGNELVDIDLSKNVLLEILEIEGNKIESLDLSNNTELSFLRCSRNEMKEMDLANNAKLYSLICDNNLLTELNLESNQEINYVECSYNELSQFKVKNNQGLEAIYCQGNQLSNLDVKDLSALEWLFCNKNSLDCIQVSEGHLSKTVANPQQWIKDDSANFSSNCSL